MYCVLHKKKASSGVAENPDILLTNFFHENGHHTFV